MNMIYRMLTVSMLIPLHSSALQLPKEHIILDSKILALCDGVPYMLDAIAFSDMLHVRKLSMNLINGVKGDKKTFYAFGNTRLSVQELADYETEHGMSPELDQVLHIVAEDFIAIAGPFMDQARGTKQFMTQLIEEWVEKRDRQDSLLLDWHQSPEGKEFEIFRQNIKSFNQLLQFCSDMITFMQDLMYNCPKGFEQLLELKKNHKS